MALVYAAIAAINAEGPVSVQKKVDCVHKKNHAASLFLMADQLAAQNECKQYTAIDINLDIRELVK